MKNKEKYAEEIFDDFANKRYCDFRKKYILENHSCNKINCKECNELTKEWLEAEYVPPKTRQSEFLKLFPNARKYDNGALNICPYYLDDHYKCINSTEGGIHCKDCCQDYWGEEIE